MLTFTASHLLLTFQLSTLALSATLSPPPFISLLKNNASSPSPPLNTTPLSRPANRLPEDPHSYRVPSTPITVKTYDYGDPLRDPTAVQDVLVSAFRDAAAHPPNLAIAAPKLQYSEKNLLRVDLVLLPGPDMKWQMWRFAVLGLGAFMEVWDEVWLSFDVEVEGVGGRVGTGYVFKNFDGV